MTNKRIEYFPQMKNYDQMNSGRVVPFAMLAGPKNYSCSIINTDRYGFRSTILDGKKINVEDIGSFQEVNFLIGGSTVFGVGSPGNDQTISSMLSKMTKEIWLNLGIRGGVSLQELIHFIKFYPKAKKVKNIVLFSGANDLYVNLLFDDPSEWDRRFEEKANEVAYKSWKKVAFCKFFSKILRVPSALLYELTAKEILLMAFNGKLKAIKKAQKEVKCLTYGEKLKKLEEVFKRNLLVYSSLSKTRNLSLIYILQPFAPWTQKQYSQEETEVLKWLEEEQANTSWSEIKKKMSLHSTYIDFRNILHKVCKELDVTFVDSNTFFNKPDTLFVDNIHLNQIGNQVAANLIHSMIKPQNVNDEGETQHDQSTH